MSEWASRIREHRIWNVMKALGPALDEAEQLDDIDPSAVATLERIRAILALAGKRLGSSSVRRSLRFKRVTRTRFSLSRIERYRHASLP